MVSDCWLLQISDDGRDVDDSIFVVDGSVLVRAVVGNSVLVFEGSMLVVGWVVKPVVVSVD